jgi:hypothetical protein
LFHNPPAFTVSQDEKKEMIIAKPQRKRRRGKKNIKELCGLRSFAIKKRFLNKQQAEQLNVKWVELQADGGYKRFAEVLIQQ